MRAGANAWRRLVGEVAERKAAVAKAAYEQNAAAAKAAAAGRRLWFEGGA